MTIDVNGTKRDALPSTLEKTELVITVKDAEDEEEFLSLARQAAAECSIYNTISQVSEMEWRVIFQ